MFHVRALLLLLLFSLTSCARLPVAELTAYSESVTAANTAGNQILDLVVPALLGQTPESQEPCARNSAGVRPCFTVDLALGGTNSQSNEPREIQIRRLALEVLETYSTILVDISEGRSVEVVRQRGEQLSEINARFQTALAGSVSSAAIGPLIAASTDVVATVVDATSQAVGVRSVVEAEPDVRSMIQLLIADTPTLYEAYRNQFIANRGDLVLEIAELRILAQELEGEELAANEQQRRQLQAQLNAARSGSGNVVQIREFEEALTNYVRILNATDVTLVALREAITLEAQNPIDRASEFSRRAAETRVWLDQLEENLSNLRAATR